MQMNYKILKFKHLNYFKPCNQNRSHNFPGAIFKNNLTGNNIHTNNVSQNYCFTVWLSDRQDRS